MSVCLNHPDRDAEYRCVACQKPVCSECVIEEEGRTFCSVKCQAGAKMTSDGVGHFQEEDAKNKKKAFIRKLVFVIVLLIILGGAFAFSQTPQGKKLMKKYMGGSTQTEQIKK